MHQNVFLIELNNWNQQFFWRERNTLAVWRSVHELDSGSLQVAPGALGSWPDGPFTHEGDWIGCKNGGKHGGYPDIGLPL